MEKELLELFDSAKKAADAAATDGVSLGGADEQRCVDALKQMKKVPVTMKVLVDTQVGRKIRSLTKHPQKKIKAVASELFEMWKSIVVEEAKNKQNGSTDVTSSSMSSTTSSMTVEVSRAEAVNVQNGHQSNSVRVENVSRAETIKVEKTDHSTIRSEKVSRSETVKVQRVQNVKVEKNGEGEPVKVEKVVKEEKQTSGVKRPLQAPNGIPKLTSMIKSNDSGRDKVRELLAEALSKVSSEIEEDRIDEVNASDPIRVAVSVESVLFDKWGKSTGQHKFKYRSVMFNIKDAKNPDLRRRILLGEIKPERLITMTPEEMASDQRKQENTQIKEKALFECERAGAPKATTDQFKCGRCQQRKTTYYQLQTRSADEPMTTFVTCVNCNNHWKFC